MTLAFDIDRFLTSSRELFNAHFRSPDPWADPNAAWDLLAVYEPVRKALFRALVTEPHQLEPIEYGHPHPQIAVSAKEGRETVILLNRDVGKSHGYWDHPVDRLSPSAALRFVSFFDWADIERADYRYVMVEVTAWPDAPELVGRFGLIETHAVSYVRVG